MKKCPLCNISFKQAIVANVEVDYCPRCYGLWFEEGELAQAKDDKDRSLRWLDIDLWKDLEKMHISQGKKQCPVDRMPLYEVRYDDSETKVDVCNICHGIWLDRGEFKAIISYLREKGEYDVLHHYTKALVEEVWEVFSGPKLLQEHRILLLAIT